MTGGVDSSEVEDPSVTGREGSCGLRLESFCRVGFEVWWLAWEGDVATDGRVAAARGPGDVQVSGPCRLIGTALG